MRISLTVIRRHALMNAISLCDSLTTAPQLGHAHVDPFKESYRYC